MEERTEGWIAGLQMAALSMHNRKDIPGFIQSFTGTNRYILDYLVTEILDHQPPEIREFLLSTSILQRLTAPLCDALLEIRGLGSPGGSETQFSPRDLLPSQWDPRSILEYLERENLFLVPLDDERTWFRYHHLFADLLGTQLLRIHPQLIPLLHSRASIWYEQNGWLDQAIEHAFSAGDIDRAAWLVDKGAQKLIYQISFERMQNWIDRMPEELVLRNTWIGITQGWLWVTKMRIGSLDSWVNHIEERFLAGGSDRYSASEQQDIPAHIASLRAYAAFFRGDLQRCAELSHQALNLLSPSNLNPRGLILVQLGETYLALQDLKQASLFLNQAIDTAIGQGDYQSVTTACMRLYQAYRTLGRLNDADEMVHRVFEALEHVGRAASPIVTKLEQCWGDLLRERGQMAEAGIQLSLALEHARQYLSPMDIVTSLLNKSRWQASQADWEGAQIALDEAGSLISSYTMPTVIVNAWSLQKARIYLERGEVERAEQEARDTTGELSSIFWARLWLKKGEHEKAQSLLSQLEQSALAGMRHGNLIQILLLQAVAFRARGDLPGAIETMIRCLTLAQPQAYLMMFVDEGEPINDLLKLLRSRPLTQPLAEYVLQLLLAFGQRRGQTSAQIEAHPRLKPSGEERASLIGVMIEPLSERELEVLQLLALGKPNKAIAEQLVVSVGTVKAHTASIYRKLDVANRTEAVARARQLGVLL